MKIRFFPQKLNPQEQKELQDLKTTLGLETEQNSFPVMWDTESDDPGVMRIQGRSLLQVMTALALGVEVPPEHLQSGLAQTLIPLPEDEQTGLLPLMTIKSGVARPITSIQQSNIASCGIGLRPPIIFPNAQCSMPLS